MSEQLPQTRMELWKLYRQEIINENNLIESIASNNKVVAKYKETIDSISPKILGNLQLDKNIGKLISINENEKSDVEVLNHFANLVDDKKLITLNEEIKEWNAKYHQGTILDQNGVKQEWLNQNGLYVRFSKVKKDIDIQSALLQEFHKNSLNQINKINNLNIENDTKLFDEIKTIQDLNKQYKSHGKTIYFIGAIISVVILVCIIICLVLIIISIK